jgi:hypothetical protein
MVIMIGTALDGLIKQGVFKPAMRTDIAQSGIGVGVRVGAPRPDVSAADALRRTLLSAHSIGYSEGGSGVYVSTELLKRLGMAEQLAPKMKLVTGELVGEAIARGDVELGIQQISKLRAVEGVDYLGPLPGDLQLASIITAAVSQNAKEAEAARAFVSPRLALRLDQPQSCGSRRRAEPALGCEEWFCFAGRWRPGGGRHAGGVTLLATAPRPDIVLIHDRQVLAERIAGLARAEAIHGRNSHLRGARGRPHPDARITSRAHSRCPSPSYPT